MFRRNRKVRLAALFTVASVSILLACFAFFTLRATALTTTPTTMNFQGRLADSGGTIMPDGLYNMKFALYTVSSGGSAVWSETRETTNRVQVTNGLFSVQLGAVSPLSASLFASGSLYFEITMATPATATCSTASCQTWESPMSPRQVLSTSAYAYNAETLDGIDSSALGQLSVNNTWTGTNSVKVSSGTALQIQNAGAVSALTVDTNTGTVVLGTAGTLGGTLQINASTSGNVTITVPTTATSYSLILPSTAGTTGQCLVNGSTPGTLSWGSCGGGGGGTTQTVILVPEYAGAVLQADGTNNAGVMTADAVKSLTLAQGYKHNYYQWTSTSSTAQDYDVVVNTQIPSDYTSGLGGFKIWSYSSNITNATATAQVQAVDGTACYGAPVSITPSTGSTWEQITLGTMSGCTFAANDVITVTLHVSSYNSDVFRVGELQYQYTN